MRIILAVLGEEGNPYRPHADIRCILQRMARMTTGLLPEEVVTAAMERIHEHGYDGFSMRSLAADLGVNPMTIYLRFDNREALLDAVAAHAVSAMEVPDLEPGNWEDQVVEWARAVRTHLLGFRSLLPVLRDSAHLGTAMAQLTEQLLELLLDAGFDDTAAAAASRALFWHAVGFALAHDALEQAASVGRRTARLSDATPNLQRLAVHLGPFEADELFDHTTRLLAHGLRNTHRAITSTRNLP